jgi:hypothetical protein
LYIFLGKENVLKVWKISCLYMEHLWTLFKNVFWGNERWQLHILLVNFQSVFDEEEKKNGKLIINLRYRFPSLSLDGCVGWIVKKVKLDNLFDFSVFHIFSKKNNKFSFSYQSEEISPFNCFTFKISQNVINVSVMQIMFKAERKGWNNSILPKNYEWCGLRKGKKLKYKNFDINLEALKKGFFLS